jgi:hypothetical protein
VPGTVGTPPPCIRKEAVASLRVIGVLTSRHKGVRLGLREVAVRQGWGVRAKEPRGTKERGCQHRNQ